jgi:hypothetical protein
MKDLVGKNNVKGIILKWELTSITFLNFNSVGNILKLGIPNGQKNQAQ